MAVSEQTQAIIDRLKNEGDLIRNSGTNSVRSVNLKLEKFDSLFTSINNQVTQQTEILKSQFGIASDAAERARTQEQFDEVSSKSSSSYSNEDTKEPKPLSEVGEKGGNAIAKFATLKNLAMMAGGGFLLYNLSKGFVDEMFDGKFSETERGLGDLVTKLNEFKMPDIQKSFDDMNKTLAGLGDDMRYLRTMVQNTAEKMSSWSFWIGLAISSIGPFVAINRLLKIRLEKLKLENAKVTPPKGGSPDGDFDGPNQPKTGNYDVDTNNPNFRGWDADGKPVFGDMTGQKPVALSPDGTPRISSPNPPVRSPVGDFDSPTQPRAPGAMDGPPVIPGTINTPVTPDSFSRLQPQAKLDLRPEIATRTGGRVGFNKAAGRFTANANGTGAFLSDADAIAIMEQTVNPQYSRAYRNVVRLLKIIAPFAAAYEIYRFYAVFNDDTLDENTRIARLSGILSGFMTGTAMGLLASRAAMVFGPWASLISGLVVGVSFGFGAEYLTEAIVKWILDKNASAEEPYFQAKITEQSDVMQRYGNDASNYMSAMERLQSGGSRAFADSGYNPDIGSMSLGSYNGAPDNTLGQSPYFRGNYYTDKNGVVMFQPPGGGMPIRANRRPNYVERLDDVSSAGAGVTVINHTPVTNVSQPINVSSGGHRLAVTNVSGGGGGGNGRNPYGMTPGIVA